ncbi:hypothetical protein MNBD_PLANCTO02-1859 [hydrothermal vent metagenome]|uniref:Nickel insertion protein n=1 Tax=hydrothermal vent metagenome TaxID=652676 RepID=A0A3B1DSR6_9ZZZZ
MKIAYFDCACGISGDMTLAALIDSGADVDCIRKGIDSLNLPDVELQVDVILKGCFRATQIKVHHPEQHAHRHLRDIFQLIDAASAITQSQKELSKRLFQAVAEAEASVHGTTLEKVHFHEVGAIDSIVDIVGVAIAFDLLKIDKVVCSKIPTGRGEIRIDHGVCTIPAPGTAELLKGIPLVDVPIEAELTTPTGAAFVKVLVDQFAPLPAMTIASVGYGAGTYDFPDRANLLRIFLGETDSQGETDSVVMLETNLDDVSGEVIGFTKQKLFDAGALDVYTTPIQMKKDRPGVILSLICHPADADQMESILFQETNTFGIRKRTIERSIRSRQSHTVQTDWGTVTGKMGWRQGEATIFVPEFESCAQLAKEHQTTLHEIYRAAERNFDNTTVSTKPFKH